MINAGELYRRAISGALACHLLNTQVEIEEQATLSVVTHHALNPKEGAHARASRDRGDVVQAACRVQHHVARRKLRLVHSLSVFHRQLAAVVLIRS